ncbi:hypothetical protein SELMODRAFT_425733 [Selaginella moellendorffii]|uniref:Uncharacterized protein n=1 Tax=Selaginella moellendorffii TaxID=88036 RepID=D8SU37_SELML|nr:hypothetical protein SELMODRAFT_425733 [Selaginella moellendorffii]
MRRLDTGSLTPNFSIFCQLMLISAKYRYHLCIRELELKFPDHIFVFTNEGANPYSDQRGTSVCSGMAILPLCFFHMGEVVKSVIPTLLMTFLAANRTRFSPISMVELSLSTYPTPASITKTPCFAERYSWYLLIFRHLLYMLLVGLPDMLVMSFYCNQEAYPDIIVLLVLQ